MKLPEYQSHDAPLQMSQAPLQNTIYTGVHLCNFPDSEKNRRIWEEGSEMKQGYEVDKGIGCKGMTLILKMLE